MTRLISRHWLFQISLLAAVYFFVGKLALCLAVDPGYASPVWPPAGIGVAALLLFGLNRSAGCFIGSFLITMQAFAPDALSIAVIVSVGSTGAIFFSAFLVRRFLHYPKSFYLEKDILLFLLICGPLLGLISSTWSVSALLIMHKISAESFFINWLHWFIGDSTGGIIFSSLALVFSTKSRAYWLGSVTKVLLPLAGCLALVILALQYINKIENKQLHEEFHKQAELSLNLLEKDLNSFHAHLGTLQSFFDNSLDVSREEFQNFTFHLLARSPAIKALLWVPLVSERSYKFRVLYAEPADHNQHFSNRDLGNHREYKDLILNTLRTRKLTSSAPMFLEHDESVALALAVSHPRGVLIEVIDPENLLKSFLFFNDDGSYRARVRDITQPQKPIDIISNWQGQQQSLFFKGQLRSSKTLLVGDRQWVLEIEQDPSLKSSGIMNTGTFLFTSLIFSFLTCALLLTIANRIITTQAVVAQKTEHLQELNLQLEKASRTKSEFLANMSHEIRTPLNVIVGMADLLEDAPLEDHQRHYLEISRKAGDNLLNIINDILDISKIESGLVTLEKRALDLPEMVSEVYEMFLPKAHAKKLDFRLHMDDKIKNTYLGDVTRTRQILTNLVSNALKFTEKGFIEIRVSAFTDATTPGNILFEVQDTGIGLAEEIIPTLFKPFTQADSTITRKFGGTGLGLSISKRLTEMMNGTMGVKSHPGLGSTFHFTLTLPHVGPAKMAGANISPPRVDSSAMPSLKILIVDDAEDNRMLIRAYLQGTPHHLVEADNGMEALDVYQSQEFDIVLMDMQMPGMDGFTAVRKIREFENQSQRKPAHIWALTAYALKNEIQRSMDAGCERHLTKPLRKQTLLNEIGTFNQLRH